MGSWLDLDNEIEELQDTSKYVYLDLGVQSVNPLNIVALSRELDQNRIEKLQKSIEKIGWKDISPNDFSLILLPDGRYAVESGGNHRAFMSRELKIPLIKATVITYLDLSLFSADELSRLKTFQNNKDSLLSTILNKRRKGQNRLEELESLEKLNNEMNSWLLQLYDKYKSKYNDGFNTKIKEEI